MKNLVKKKIKHLKKLGFKKDELIEIEKMYSGEFFNPKDKGYLKLINLSSKLCDEYNHMGENLGKNPSIFKIWFNYNKKRKIIKKLFPIKGILSSVGPDLDVVIGQVDFLGCGFMNKRCHFSKFALVTCENYSIFANMITVGDENIEKKGDLIKLGRVHIGSNTWICAGVKIKNGVSIGSNCVLGAGAVVESDMPDYKTVVGCPAMPIKDIEKNFKIKFDKVKVEETDRIKEIVSFVKSQGFHGGLKEYKKALSGIAYNSTNLKLGRMFLYSHRLSVEYNSPLTTKERKEEILNILFYKHGKNLKVGNNLYVDLLGMVTVGDNVTIGDGLCISGNVYIGDNVKIGDNVSLFATGHGIHANERRVGFSIKRGLYEFSTSDTIIINNDANIGNNCIIAPKSEVEGIVEDDYLVIKNKKIKI